MVIEREDYLGDGLFVSFDGFMVTLRTLREGGDHWVGLEPQVLKAFEEWVAELRKNIAAMKENT